MFFSFPWHLIANSWGQTQEERSEVRERLLCAELPRALGEAPAFTEYGTSPLERTVNVVRFTPSVLYLPIN